IPSTTSSSVWMPLASSTVITPSLPTFCIASEIILPISVSPFAATAPTCAVSAGVVIFLDLFFNSSTTAITARSMPRFRSIGFMPAATALAPSRTIACANTVAVVVPSPATVLVLLATSRTICAPMFSNLSESSISFATVTPSLVMRGAPKLLSSTTLRPFGPSVTFTASARISTPRSIRWRASPPNLTSLAAICRFPSCCVWLSGLALGGGRGALDDAHDVGLLHDQEFLAIQLHLGAGPLAEQDAVLFLDVERHQLAGLVAGARADGDDLAFHRLLLRRVGDDDAARGLFLGFEPADHDAVVQGTELHSDRSLNGLERRLLGFAHPVAAPGRVPQAPFLALYPPECQPSRADPAILVLARRHG